MIAIQSYLERLLPYLSRNTTITYTYTPEVYNYRVLTLMWFFYFSLPAWNSGDLPGGAPHQIHSRNGPGRACAKSPSQPALGRGARRVTGIRVQGSSKRFTVPYRRSRPQNGLRLCQQTWTGVAAEKGGALV